MPDDKPKKYPRRCVICGAVIHHQGWDRLCDSLECEKEFAESMEQARQEAHEEVDERFGHY